MVNKEGAPSRADANRHTQQSRGGTHQGGPHDGGVGEGHEQGHGGRHDCTATDPEQAGG